MPTPAGATHQQALKLEDNVTASDKHSYLLHMRASSWDGETEVHEKYMKMKALMINSILKQAIRATSVRQIVSAYSTISDQLIPS